MLQDKNSGGPAAVFREHPTQNEAIWDDTAISNALTRRLGRRHGGGFRTFLSARFPLWATSASELRSLRSTDAKSRRVHESTGTSRRREILPAAGA